MAIFQNAYDALPESRFIKRGIVARQRKAEKLIHKAPNTAKGYLDLAKTFIEQDNLRAALEVYDNGINSIVFSLDELDNSSKNTMGKNSFSTTNVSQQRKKLLSNRQKNEDTTTIIAAQQHDLTILKKERLSILVTLEQRTHRFHQSLPYDILYEIFGHLDEFNDLWECNSVCKRWRHFMCTWPPFWNKMSPAKTPLKDKSTVLVADRHKSTHTIYLNGPLNKKINLKAILDILQSVASDISIEKLHFKNFRFNQDESDNLASVLTSMKSPTFKHVEFIDCNIPDEKIVTPFIKACSNLTSIIYKEKNNGADDNPISGGVTCNCLKEPINWFPFLTYLKLFIGLSTYSYYNSESRFKTRLFHDNMLAQCPNLMHLFLDAREAKMYLGACAATVFKNCPRLKNVILGNDAEMPKTVASDIDEQEFINNDNDIDSNIIEEQSSERPATNMDDGNKFSNKNIVSSSSSNKTPTNTAYSPKVGSAKECVKLIKKVQPPSTATKGLRRFVILNSHLTHYYREHDSAFQRSNRSAWSVCFSILNQLNRDSLELLHIPYNMTTAQGLHKWCDLGIIASSLRELFLTGDLPDVDIAEKHIGSIDKHGVLGKLIPLLPALQILTIRQSSVRILAYPKPRRFYDKRGLFVDDDVLYKLVKHCRQIRHIKIIGYPLYSPEAVYALAKSGSPDSNPFSSSVSKKLPIEYLEMDIDRDIILPFVKEIHSLKMLHVRMDRYNIKGPVPMDPNDRQEAISIINERGGSLTIVDEYKRAF